MRRGPKGIYFVLVAATSIASTGAFGENQTERFFDKLKPQEKAMGVCYRFNAIRFAEQTCEPASTVVDAAFGACQPEEQAYIDASVKLAGPAFVDNAEDIIARIKQRIRQSFLVLDARIKTGRCSSN